MKWLKQRKLRGGEFNRLQARIAGLSQELEVAHKMSERAMAQQTRSGHVYVISNVGSFGENIYKIGMTRRLEPLERVKELGDASVPFKFDIHAMIYSEDAPTVEKAIHKVLNDKRVNLVNYRKEFFNVGLADIEVEIKKISSDAEFVLTSEAREYRESKAIRSERDRVKSSGDVRASLPASI